MNIANKLNNQNTSIFIVSIFILALPFVINVNVSDMVMSIRYLSISILIFSLCLLKFKNGIITDILKNPIVISLILLFCVNILSALYHDFNADAIVSLYRLLVLLSLTIFFANIFVKKDYLLIGKSILIFTIISLLIYFWQIYIAFTHEKDFIRSIETTSATMGNKNLLASILFLSLPFLFYVYQSTNKLVKLLILFVLLLILCSFILIQSKAVLLALLFMSTSIILFAFKGNLKIILSFLFIIVIIISTLYITKPKIALQFQEEIEQIIRTKNNFLEDRLVKNDARVSLYVKTIDMIKDNPLLGVGPGNWRKEFPKYGLTNTISEKGVAFAQRPHSDFLWFFSEGGLMSGIFYVLIFIFLLKDTLFFYFKCKSEKRYFFLVLFSTILGYGIISLFDFPSERPSHNLFFAIILGIIISEKLKKGSDLNTSNQLFGIILICLFSVNIAFANIRYKGDLHMTKALRYKSINNWDKMIDELDIAYNQYLYDTDNTTTPLMWYYGLAYFNKGQVNIAFDYFKQAYSINPYHLHVINNLATCYGYNNDYIKASELYEECLLISPRFEEAALNLAAIYSYEERNEDALDILLGIHNFNLTNKSYITDIYINYFRNISSALLQEKSYSINYQGIEKNHIFVQGNEDRDLLFKQIKHISWMRKEKEMPYKKIFMNLEL